MTLNLLLADEPVERPVILADPAGTDLEALVAGLTAQLGEVTRLVFPLPDETTRRHATSPPLMRSRHANLWHALSAEERERVLLAAGRSATMLAPALGPQATTLVAIRDPAKVAVPGGEAWRFVLGAFAELDEIPEEPGPVEEREGWRERAGVALAGLTLLRAVDLAAVTAAVAAAVGLGPQRAARAARAASEAAPAGLRRPDRPVHWLDEMLYALSTPPQEPQPRKRRRVDRRGA